MRLFQYAAAAFLFIGASGSQLGAQGSLEGTIKVENPWS